MIRKYTKFAVLVSMFTCLMVVPALATGDSGSGSSLTGIALIMSYMDEVTELCNQVWTMLTSNAYFALYLCVGLLGVGISVFRRIKRVARH